MLTKLNLDLIPHHATATHVRIHEQGPRGRSHDGLKGCIQVDESPIAVVTEFVVVLPDGSPKHRRFVRFLYVLVHTGGVQIGYRVHVQFLLQIRTQEDFTIFFLDHPFHLVRQIFADHEVWVCRGLTCIFVIGEQFFSFPLELDESSQIVVQERPSKRGFAIGPVVADSIFSKKFTILFINPTPSTASKFTATSSGL